MIPFCDGTVTIYHYSGKDTWIRQVVNGVKWRGGAAHRSSGAGKNAIDPAGHMIIPLSVGKRIKMDAGGRDYVVFGNGKNLNDGYTPEDLKKDHPEFATISKIEDRTNAPFLQHWKVTLE